MLAQNDQLAEAARSHRVLAIVLFVGGNDIGFSSIVGGCVLAFLGAEPRLIVQSYPAPMPQVADLRYPESGRDRVDIGGCPFLDADMDWARSRLIGQLGGAIREVAAERDAQFLELRDAFRGHELCSDAATQPETAPTAGTSEWMRWIDLAGQGNILESLHPNAYGQAALGRCLRLTLLFAFGADVSCHGTPRTPAVLGVPAPADGSGESGGGESD